jgi:YD repeat-containing protein
MLVTRIEDRFGNYLTYTYDSSDRLTGITASDGRALSVQYSDSGHLIRSITLQAADVASRTWTYAYAPRPGDRPGATELASVSLPDGKGVWTFDLAALTNNAWVDLRETASVCDTVATPNNVAASYTGTITHPSGLTGTFTVAPVKRGRSYVYRDCWNPTPNGSSAPTSPGSFAHTPKAWYGMAIKSRQYSGAGLASPYVWQYSYSPANESWSQDSCASAGTCARTVWTDETDPRGNGTRHTFSNVYDASESNLVRTDYYAGAVGGTLLRSEISTYANPTGGPWPASMGYNPQPFANQAQTRQVSPLAKRDIVQDGNTYTWEAEAFNSYAQVTKVKRSNSFQSAVEEQTDYLNDTVLWALGLPTKVTNLTTGEVVDQYVYNSTNDTLAERWHFGQKLMSYSFNAQGQLASFTDGNTKTTTLGSYKRGIPQSIGYPDGTSQSLVVDDLGQIRSITDQAGATTTYTYDPVGRLARIDYPSGDEQAWYPKTFTYDFVTGAERGLGANHWRRTVAKGAQRQVTYFDAQLRPVLADTYIDGNAGSHSNVRSDYDFKGLTTFASYPIDGTPSLSAITAGTLSTYDALGRLTATQQTSELGTLTTSTAYLSGARKQVTDPKGKVTTTTYQVFDQPSYDAVIQVDAPAGVTQVITRDLYGNPLAIRQYGSYNGLSGDVTKTLVYDAYHRLCRTTEPESGSEVMAYDNANNLLWSAAGLSLTGTGCGLEQVAEAGKTKRTYDAMNRLSTLAPPAGTQSTTYGYDALGNLKSAVSGITTWSATRNKLGQLTSETLQLTGQGAWTLGYAHDAYGSLQSLTYPDGMTLGYAPDALGRPTQVGNYATGVTYFPNGEVKSFSYGNGALYAADQNDRQLLRNFTYGTSGALAVSEDYSYDANGNITSVADLVDGRRTKSFGYDDLNRLTSATAGNLWGTESYTYDPLNNIRSRVGNGATFTYNYDGWNRLASISGAGNSSFGYDNRGNVTSRNGSTLQFDLKNQLMQIDGLASYSYDAAGRRVKKTPAGGSSTYYFYTQAGQLLYQRDEGAATGTDFVYLGRKLIASEETLILVAPASIGADTSPNDGNYTVSWSAAAAATSYTVQESANGGAWSTIYTGSGLSLAINGRAGGSYRYQVSACAGSTCTGWTGSATVGVRPALPVVTVPTGTINGTYSVSWSAPASATAYDVQEQVNGGAWTTIASDTIATSISRPGTTSGSYAYRVSAKNTYGSRGWATSGAVTVDITYGVLPDVPASLTVPASSTNGTAALSWSAASLATRYVLQQSANGGASWSAVYDGSATGASVSGLADGSYRYQVQACNTYGCSGWRAGSATLVVLYPPSAAPTLSTPAASNTGSYTVTWSGVPGQVSYTLQEAANGGAWTTVQTAGNTTWAASGRINGSYAYRVQACNSSGCGPWSATGTTVVTYPPASAPTVSAPGSSNNGSYTVSWTAVSTATSYTLQEQVNGGAWTTLQSNGTTSAAVSGRGNGTYGYRAQACNVGGCGPWSATGTTVVTYPPSTAPTVSAPGSNNSGSYTVSWTAVSTATSYTLQEQLNSGAWTTIQSNGATSAALSGKGNGTYGYRTQACNAGGCGPWSTTAAVGVTLIPATPLYPPSVSYTGPSYKPVVNVQWSAASSATSYQLEQTHPQEGVSIVYTGAGTSWSALTFATGTVKYRVKACSSAGCSGFSPYGSIVLNSGGAAGLAMQEPATVSAESATTPQTVSGGKQL